MYYKKLQINTFTSLYQKGKLLAKAKGRCFSLVSVVQAKEWTTNQRKGHYYIPGSIPSKLVTLLLLGWQREFSGRKDFSPAGTLTLNLQSHSPVSYHYTTAPPFMYALNISHLCISLFYSYKKCFQKPSYLSLLHLYLYIYQSVCGVKHLYKYFFYF